MLSHSQFILQHDSINSKVFFFMPYLCTSSSDSELEVQRYGMKKNTSELLSHFGWQLVGPIQHGSTSYTLNNTQFKKPNWKIETAINFVKPKRNQKLQLFAKRTQNRTEVIFSQPHTPDDWRLWYNLWQHLSLRLFLAGCLELCEQSVVGYVASFLPFDCFCLYSS